MPTTEDDISEVMKELRAIKEFQKILDERLALIAKYIGLKNNSE